ncbi:MAG: hypothetical protein GY765_25395 [bacterium]|nr:hypothetical protein [bacterium]
MPSRDDGSTNQFPPFGFAREAAYPPRVAAYPLRVAEKKTKYYTFNTRKQ